MSVELHLPDLPEVPISLGELRAARPPAGMSWPQRLRQASVAYLPLLLMAVLALASWWLVKNSPRLGTAAREPPQSAEPDYIMNKFAMQRFDARGRLRLRIDGARMRHFPATDRIEVDDAQIESLTEDGRVTRARARQAVGNGDGSEVQLLGGAEVSSRDAEGVPLVMRSEFLHLYLVTEQVRSHLPVLVRLGSSEVRAAGLDYDHASRRLELAGPMRAELAPRGAPAARLAAP